jgi:hypothetical protein
VAASQIAVLKYLNIAAVSKLAPLFNMALSQNLPLYMRRSLKTRR